MSDRRDLTIRYIKQKQLKPLPGSLPPLTSAPPAPKPAEAKPVATPATPVPKLVAASKPATTNTTTPAGQYTDQPASTMRQVIAKRLTASKFTIPHGYMAREIKSDQIGQLRKLLTGTIYASFGSDDVESGAKVSLNDLIIKAVASALDRVPAVNVQWDEANGQVCTSASVSYLQIKYQNTVDISVAVAIDGGLITPIVTNANSKKVTDIAKEVKELAAAAKEGKLQPHQYQGTPHFQFCL